jgi:hypothetical protein
MRVKEVQNSFRKLTRLDSAYTSEPNMSEAQGQMNSVGRFLWSLFLPRLPKLEREDVASTAEYCNRLARLDEAALNSPGVWQRRISRQLTVHIQVFKAAEKAPQKFLRRAAPRSVARVLRRDLLENGWKIISQK